MRVLERECAPTYSMGKKTKHKLRKQKENEVSDSSEEVTGRGCLHVSKAVNFSAMKKGLGKQTFGECAGCAKEAVKKEAKSVIDQLELEGATSSDFSEEADPTLWVCLQCGNQGCGRLSPEKHALKHYQTPRSSQHNVVINTSNWTAWCYECDDELQPDKYKKVSECMEHIKKLACVPLPDTGKNSGSNGSASPCVDGINKGRPLSGKGALATGCQKVKGLNNLGNTCFFNAVIQNLTQTYSLEGLLVDRKKTHSLKLQGHGFLDGNDSSSSSDEGDKDSKNYLKEIPSIEVSVSDPGPLTQALVVFLQDSYTRSSTINPSALFGQVCKKAPRFKGMQQQDSHELLRYLMDNMKTEEIKRGQTGILKYFKMSENVNPKKVDEETKYKVKAYGNEVKHTFVECLFGGQLISTVVCEECKYISQILEPFLDLSLPVTEEKPQRPNQAYGSKKKEGMLEIKEEQTDGAQVMTSKDDKPSKHQLKKQRKSSKKQKNKGPKEKYSSPENGEKDEEEQEEKEDEKEEGEEGEKPGASNEAWEDSDADVEDNLESDTSRCYTKTNSDSINSAIEDLPLCSEDQLTSEPVTAAAQSTSQPQDSYTQNGTQHSGCSQTCNGFNVETNIENCTSTPAAPCQKSVTDRPIINGYCSNGDNSINISYSVTNGYVKEESNGVLVNCDADFTLPAPPRNCKEPCSDKVDGKRTSVTSANNGDCGLMNGCLENGIVNGDVEHNRETIVNSMPDSKSPELAGCSRVAMSESTSKESMEGTLTDITSTISTLSLGDRSSVSLSSDVSRLTLSNEPVINTGGQVVGERSEVKVEGSGSVEVTEVKAPVEASLVYNKRELMKEGQRKSINVLSERYHPSSGECSIESCLHQFTAAELLTGNNKFGCKNCTKLKYKNHPHKEKKEMVYSNANKQYLIFQPPAVLTLHLKRFEQVGFSSRKVNRHVDFPFVLDIAPYCSGLSQGIKSGQKKILYALYGVVEHSGRLTSGHYTAYVKVRPNMGTLNHFLNKHNVTLKEYLHKYTCCVINGDRLSQEPKEDVVTEELVPPGRWFHISDSRVNEVTEATVERAQAYLLFYERIN